MSRLSLITISILLVVFGLLLAVNVWAYNVLSPERAVIDESRMLTRINDERASKGLETLTIDPTLDDKAQQRAEGLCNVALSHDNYVSELKESGYQYTESGENLAEGTWSTDKFVNAWINSPTHYANIVKPAYKDIGIGVAECGHKQVIVNWFGTKK